MWGRVNLSWPLFDKNELEEENRCNHEIRLTAKRVEATAIRNDAFDLESLDRLLLGVLGSVDRIIKAAYYNTLGS